MEYKNFISADSHVNEAPDLWQTRLPANLRERGPRVVDFGGGDAWVIGEGRPMPMGLNAMAGKRPEEYKSMGVTYREMRPGSWDPAARLEDMDMDGIDAEVLYPGLGKEILGLEDPDLRRACVMAYNDWLDEMTSYAPERLVGLALIPLDDTDFAVKELERVRKTKGIRGVFVTVFPGGSTLTHASYEPAWEAAAGLKLPVSVHVGGGSLVNHLRSMAQEGALGARESYITLATMANVEPIAMVVFSGLLSKYHDLRFVSGEGGVGYLAYFLGRADDTYNLHRFYSQFASTEPPSEVFHRQVYATFERDPSGIMARYMVGVHNIMWASDYPHSATTWPDSHRFIKMQFEHIPAAETARITRDNAGELYGLIPEGAGTKVERRYEPVMIQR